MNPVSSGLAMCAKCNRPVERVTKYADFLHNEDVYTVFCHGDSTEFRISYEDIDANNIEATQAWFFMPELKDEIRLIERDL